MGKDAVTRAGVVDIGSSSIKLLIAQQAGDNIEVLESLKNPAPIGNYTFFKSRISQSMINQTLVILQKYARILKEYEISRFKTIATTAIREAKNRDIFIDTILRKTGLNVEVFAVGDVIYYIDSYLYHRLKNTYPIHSKNLLIAELGAGSLDISILEKGFTIFHIGLPIGTLRLRQVITQLAGSMDENADALMQYIANEFMFLKRSMPTIHIDDFILIDENYSTYIPRVLSAVKPESHFYPFTKSNADELLNELIDKNPEEIAHQYRLPLEISDTFSAYAAILKSFFSLNSHENIYILETSLAEAVLAHIIFQFDLSKKYDKYHQLISLAKNIGKKYQIDMDHAEHVAGLSVTLFKQLNNVFGLEKSDLLYLELAALLHDIGMFIHNRAHHKHTEYIINSLNLFRLSDEEIKVIACIARYHRKAPPLKTHPMYTSLPHEKRILVQKLSSLLRIANALDRSHTQKIKKLDVKINKNQDVTLIATTTGNYIIEHNDFLSKKTLFEEITGNKINITFRT
ncbi:MAG: HD domain-containing protein [Elusimicrobia bacterium]|nr:HD domain-containing protein [Elusimicrobiota bacterium]MBD3412231.1 HD domain-containing protein [Elusimicrobiota bacterium]